MENINQTIDQESKAHYEKEALESANIETVKKAYQMLDEQNLYGWKELMAPDCKGYLGSAKEPMDIDDLIPMIKSFYTAFPDYKHHTEQIFAKGDYVVTRMRYTGTHKARFMEKAPTGNTIDYNGNFIFRLRNGKITEVYGVEDELNMMMQLGFQLR